MSEIQNLIESVPASTRSSREESLSPETRTQLDAFVDFLVSEGKTPATSRSYRSYVVSALIILKDGGSWSDMSSDVRSGARAFARFTEGA